MSGATKSPGDLPRLRRRESIRGGLSRVLLGCLDRANQAMAAAGGADEVEAVHQARVALKRARAVLRLGEAAGIDWAGPARRRLARRARDLAVVRDEAVIAETASGLGVEIEFVGAMDALHWQAWCRSLRAERKRLAKRPWPQLTPPACQLALAETVRQLDESEQRLEQKNTAHRLHAWRKAVIALREQLNVLHVRLTPDQQKRAGQLHRVARQLGRVQDLALLLAAGKHRGPAFNRKSALMTQARAEQEQVIARARRLARGLSAQLRSDFGVG